MENIGLIDYGSGNLSSVYLSLLRIYPKITVVKGPQELSLCDKLILPGVGAFGAAMEKLNALDLVQELNQAVIVDKKPFLGICVGMQILAEKGFEFGEFKGLSWVNTSVKRFELANPKLPLPHIGWNDVEDYKDFPLFDGINSKDPSFYFVHSYCMDIPTDKNIQVCLSFYDKPFVAAIRKNNIFGVQFHPEKSQKNGLQLLKNFINFRA